MDVAPQADVRPHPARRRKSALTWGKDFPAVKLCPHSARRRKSALSGARCGIYEKTRPEYSFCTLIGINCGKFFRLSIEN